MLLLRTIWLLLVVPQTRFSTVQTIFRMSVPAPRFLRLLEPHTLHPVSFTSPATSICSASLRPEARRSKSM